MDWLRLPSLNALRAFSAVAEAGSFTRAARQLNVTHAAVSQQVRQLEQRLGLPLVIRRGRGIALTVEGEALARDLDVGFATIGRGVERLTETTSARPVQVTMSPAFAVEWLLPRLSQFQRAHPEITLLLNPTAELVALKPGGTDVAIRYRDGRRREPGLKLLLVSDMIVIGTPSLVEGKDLTQPAFLTAMPWLQELGTNEVMEWFTCHGVEPEHPVMVNQMPGNLIMDAVRRGDGLTYTARAFFRDDLASGRVVELFSDNAFGIYHVETGPEPLRPSVRVFTDWLLRQAETVTA